MVESLLREGTETVILGPAPREGYYVFAQRAGGDFAREGVEVTRAYTDGHFSKSSAFSGRDSIFIYDKRAGQIKGSSLFWNTALDESYLRGKGLWFPGVKEGRKLDEKGKLINGVYRDFGAIVYSDKYPNSEIASPLVTQLITRGLVLPTIASFRNLDQKAADNKYGVELSLNGETRGLISGAEAQTEIDKLVVKSSSGVHRLIRSSYGHWNGIWDDLGSNDDGRVDWVCGVATRENLEAVMGREVRTRYDEEARAQVGKIERERDEAMTALSNQFSQ